MRISIFIAVLLLASCGSDTTDKIATDTLANKADQIVLTAGSITTLSCKLNVANGYEVYLPKTLSDSARYPVLIFFSPDGNGKIPVLKYQELADKWEFILIGSNYTKNGMEAQLAMKGANELVTDVKSRFNVDGARVYLSGFSGGARIAGGLALSRMDVTGVICCSASPPADLAPRGYVGIAGLGDMNYLEMKKFQKNVKPTSALSELLVFDGKHEWPPVSVFENAMLMISIYQPGQAVSGDFNQMSDSLTANILLQCDSVRKVSCLLENMLVQSGIRAEKNLSGVGALESRARATSNASCINVEQKKWDQVEADEAELQKVLAESVLAHDTLWWRANQAAYFETNSSGPEKFMRQRLRGYVSLLCYTYTNQAFSMNNIHAAEKLVKVYSIVDPQNSEWAYLQATLFMRLNLSESAILSMDQAVSLGFNDRLRVERDPAFASLRSNPAFLVVLAKMK